MKTTNPYLTNTRFGIDKNVLLLMSILCLLSVGLMAFKLSKKDICTPYTVVSSSVVKGKSTSFYIGDPVIFNAAGHDLDELTWDFGDQTPNATGNNVQHIYTRDAAYTVTATLNGKCDQVLKLVINPIKKEDNNAVVENPIIGPDNAIAGTLVPFTCNIKATQYAWSVLNSPIPPQMEQTANISFPIQGTFIVELTLDADPSKVYRQQIIITPKKEEAIKAPATGPGGGAAPPPPFIPKQKEEKPLETKVEEKTVEAPVEKPKVVYLADDGIRANFESVVRGEIDAKAFNEFLCEGGATKVLVTSDNNRWETVESICKLFYRNKKIKKISVTTTREGECVKTINLKYDKKGFLGL